jgi:GTP diphosphokinase / guanosine-3',5'-bis(diphosphate) 3'-diphosphatase
MPEWVNDEPILARAYRLAESAHGTQPRASDGRPFLDHVTEVATLLREAGLDAELISVGLLHDSVERGNLTEETLRSEMGESISSLVMALSEDPAIESFAARKAALRDKVAHAGNRATTVFAADKLSDILGLRRGLRTYGLVTLEARLGTSVSSMTRHYEESVELIRSARPESSFLAPLRDELERLRADIPTPAEPNA